MTIKDLQDRAVALGEKYQVGSVTPKDIGDLFNDFMTYVYTLQQNLSSLGIRKIYYSYDQMVADVEPTANGFPLKFGQLVAIASVDSDGGKIYSFANPGWTYVGRVAELTAILNDFANLQTALETQSNKVTKNGTDITNLQTALETQSKNVIESIDISELDRLRIPMLSANGKADYWLTTQYGKDNLIVGRLFMFEDALKHKITQIVISNQQFSADYPNGSHTPEGLTVCYRFAGHSNADVPAGEWTPWRKIFDSDEEIDLRNEVETLRNNIETYKMLIDASIQELSTRTTSIMATPKVDAIESGNKSLMLSSVGAGYTIVFLSTMKCFAAKTNDGYFPNWGGYNEYPPAEAYGVQDKDVNNGAPSPIVGRLHLLGDVLCVWNGAEFKQISK